MEKKLSLNEREQLIKQLVDKNTSDPEIYVNLKELVLVFLWRKKACDNKEEYEDISHIIATDIFMKIYSEGEKFSYYLGYISRVYPRYIQNYRNEISNSLSYEEIAGTSLLNKPYRENSFNQINNKIYLEDIKKIIDNIMSNFCKYDKTSLAYNNLRLSLSLTLLRGRETFFHLNMEQQFYLSLLISKFKEVVYNE